jgi:serine/threonine protein kinase/CRP-like cAMP-binding protein
MMRQAILPAGVRLKAGDWFGEIALLTGSVRTANVVADSSVRLLALDRGAFEKVLGNLKDILDRKANNRMLTILPVIARLSERRREAAVEMFSIVNFSDGDTIAECGDPNPRFLLVKSGTALVWRHPSPESLIAQDPANPPPELPAEAKANNDAQTSAQNEFKNNSPMGPMTVEPSGTSRSHQRAIPESFESSFESLSSFEMVMSVPGSFGDTPTGRRDASWRTVAASNYPSIEEEGDKDMPKDTTEINTGDHVGAEAILNGTPMDCTVIAKGNVTCFVLTRDDLAVLWADEERDSPGFESKMGALGLRIGHRGSHTGATAAGNFSSDEKEIDWAQLKNLGRIGAGTFGTVLMMQDTRDKTTYAMKVLDRKRVKKMRQERRLETEKQLLRTTKSPFICKYYGDTEDDSAFYILMELVQGGELQRLIHSPEPEKRAQQQAEVESGKLSGIPHQPAKFYTAAISLPLVYLHRRAIAFRDLKPENVMIDRFGYPKLIDFGLAKPLEATGGKTYTLCGTPEYLAPEVILGTGHAQAVDWWALGVLLFEMVVGSSPFLEKGVDRRKQDHMVIFENIVENRVNYPVDMESGCKDLVRRLLTGKPAIRMGSGRRANKEFEEHPWFLGVVDWHLLNIRQIRPPWFPPIQNPTDQICFGNSPTSKSKSPKEGE